MSNNNGRHDLEGKVEKHTPNPNPKLRVLYLRGPGSDNADNLDLKRLLRNWANRVFIPENGLDALLELTYAAPHLVIADADYRTTFPANNSLVEAMSHVVNRKDDLNYTGVDFLQLARKINIPAILSPHEVPLAMPPKKQQRKRGEPLPQITLDHEDILRRTLHVSGITYAPRAKNGRTRRAFDGMLRDNFRSIRDRIASEPQKPDVHDTPFNFYVMLGSTSAGKTRTIEALLGDEQGIFWQIPKATTREERKTDKKGGDTFHVKPGFFDDLKGEYVEYQLYGHDYGLPKGLIARRLHETNILFGTASVEAVQGLTSQFNGKIVPILLYPPRAFVEKRVENTEEKKDRVAEVGNQYATFDQLIEKEEGIKYVLRFNPENMHKGGTGAENRQPGETVYDTKTQEAVDEVIMKRVRNIITLEEELRKRAVDKRVKLEKNQDFYNLWVDTFAERLFPKIGSFGELERRVTAGEPVKLFEVDNPDDVDRYTQWTSEMNLDISRNKIRDMLPRDVVAAGKSYGIAYLFLNPPGTLKYTFGTEADLVRALLMRALKPLFPYTVRAADNTHYEEQSNFAYVESKDGAHLSDLFQYRITDHDGDRRGLPPEQWPLRGIAIGFSRSKTLAPVTPDLHYHLRQENYDSMIYHERRVENGHTPLKTLIPPISLLSTDVMEPRIQEPPAHQ